MDFAYHVSLHGGEDAITIEVLDAQEPGDHGRQARQDDRTEQGDEPLGIVDPVGLEQLGRAHLIDEYWQVFLLFGAMNFYTHIGMYQNIANDTMIKW